MKFYKLSAAVTAAVTAVTMLSSVTVLAGNDQDYKAMYISNNDADVTDTVNEPTIIIDEIKPIAEGMFYLNYTFSYSNWDGQDIIVSIYDDSGSKMFDDSNWLIRDTEGSFDASVGFFDPMIEAGKTYLLMLSSADGSVSTSCEFTVCSSIETYGDINSDGKVTTADVGFANSFAKGAQKPSDTEFLAADMNGDGKITTADVGKINIMAKVGSDPIECEYEATVLKVEDGKVLNVEAHLYSESEVIDVELEYTDNAQISSDITVGDKVIIKSIGSIVEVFPPIINGVTSVVKVDE